MKAYWKYDRFDKRAKYVNVGIYDVDAINENGFTTAHWIVSAESVESAIKYVEGCAEAFPIYGGEHLEASPVFFHETAYPMPFEF